MLLFLSLLGCPEPPPEGGTVTQGTPMGAGMNNNGGAPPTGAPSGDAPPPSGEAGGPVGDVGGGAPQFETTPQHTQEELKDAEHVTLSGSLSCDSEGPWQLYLMPPPPSDGAAADAVEGPPTPLTRYQVDKAGDFSFLAPVGGTAVIVAFADVDGDLVQDTDGGIFFAQGGPHDLSADLGGLALDCSKSEAPPAPVPMEMATPEGGEPGEGPPPEQPEGAATEGAPAEEPG